MNDSVVGRVAAVLAGDDHQAWLSMPDHTRDDYLHTARLVVDEVMKAVEDDLLVAEDSTLKTALTRILGIHNKGEVNIRDVHIPKYEVSYMVIKDGNVKRGTATVEIK